MKKRKSFFPFLITSIGILVIFCIIYILLFPLPFMNVSEKTERLFIKAGFDSCTIDEMSVFLFKGIRIKNFSVKKSIDPVTELTVHIPHIVIKYHVLKTLLEHSSGKRVIREILHKQAAQQLATAIRRRSLSAFIEPVQQMTPLVCNYTKSISLQTISCTVEKGKENVFHVIRGDLSVHKVEKSPFSAEITFAADSCHFKQIGMTRAAISLKQSGAHCQLKHASAVIWGGTIQGSCNALLPEARLHNATIRISNIDCAQLYALFPGKKGSFTATSDGTFFLDTCDMTPKSLRGKGNIIFSGLHAHNLPFLQQLAQLTNLSTVKTISFDTLYSDINLQNGRITCDSVYGTGMPLSVSGKGWVEPYQRKYSFTVKGIFASAYKDSIPPIVWKALLPEDNERRFFHCTIYGTGANTSISLEKKFMNHAFGSVMQSIGDELKSLFKW